MKHVQFSYYLTVCKFFEMKLYAGGRKFKEKKEVVEPEADPERDQRTVFAYQVGRFLLCS